MVLMYKIACICWHAAQDGLCLQSIKKEIFDKYRELKSDSSYTENRNRRDYLHKKLGHIKRLIHDYDSRHFARCDADS